LARGFACDFFGVFLLVVAIRTTALRGETLHRGDTEFTECCFKITDSLRALRASAVQCPILFLELS
jgi:hypothetical protein